MSDHPFPMLVGVVVGILLLGITQRVIPFSDLNMAQDFVKTHSALIKECEKDLPRSQKCVLIATPEKNDGK